jgi:hypothetical protein
MTAATLATAAAAFGLQACRDVESKKIDHVNVLVLRFSGLVLSVDDQLGTRIKDAGARVGRLALLKGEGRVRVNQSA